MAGLNLPPIEEIDAEDLLALPEGYRDELHAGNLVIELPTTFWHKVMARRLLFALRGAGHNAFLDPGVLGDRPRDCRLPDAGVVDVLPSDPASYSHLPGSAFRLVADIMPRIGGYPARIAWYAGCGIPRVLDR